jgi:tryptophan 2,3-dioxygenase
MSATDIPVAEGAETEFDGKFSYGDYLQLDKLLDAQQPRSKAHDEMLFIIQHQTSELWMKLCIHELLTARTAIARDKLAPALKGLARVSRIFEQLNSAWDVLRTMTPSEYTRFRPDLGQSSGLQSHQYRMIEFILGNRNRAMVRLHGHRPAIAAALEAELGRLSVYDETIAFARRLGHDLPAPVVKASPAEPDQRIISFWRKVYENTTDNWALYELAEKLVDLEDYFRRWRFNHLTTVERVFGMKRGTGGTSGVGHLERMLKVELFPDLWRVRTEL